MRGTLFRLFPQASEHYPEPDLIEIAQPAGTVGPGPSDDRLVVVDAIDKPPYDPPAYAPPYRGPSRPPAWPDANGDFAHLPVDTQQFLQAHLYGCVRLTVDVWEKYLGRPVRWDAILNGRRMELVPLLEWANAHSGPGFMETGCQVNDEGELRLFCLNADVIAHEAGHTVLFAELGVPDSGEVTGHFLAFHESLSDLSALLTALHFNSVIERVLTQTNGNLYVVNDSNRIGELSSTQQIRVADNLAKMSDLADLRLSPDGAWIDPTGQGRNAHAMAQPLTGALFDFLVDLYQDNLVAMNVIPPDLDTRGWDREEVDAAMDGLQAAWGNRLGELRDEFRDALIAARDTLGRIVGETIDRVDLEGLTFGDVAGVMLEVAGAVSQRAADMLADNFQWREIEPTPAASAVAAGLFGQARRYRPLRPFAQQRLEARWLLAHACCRPARSHRHFRAAGLEAMIRAEHRAPA